MLTYLRKLHYSSFLRGVMALTTGTTLAQIVPVLLTPLLTRLYSPEDFGVFTLYSSLFGMVVLYAAGRYEQAIMLPKDNEKAINLLGLAFGILSSVVLFLEVTILGLEGVIAGLSNNKHIIGWLPWVPFSIFCMAGYQILFVWFNRKRKINLLSISKIINVLFLVAVQVYIGFQQNSAGLIYGLLAGQFAGLIFLAFYLVKDHRNELQFSWSVMKESAKEFKDFPLVNSFQSFFDTLHQHGVVLIISSFYSPAVLGNIGMARRAIGSPAALIGRSFSHNIYERAASLINNEKSLLPFLKKALISLIIVGVPIFGVLFFGADEIFPWILGGSEWGQAGEFAQLLTPYLLLNFISSPLAVIPLVIKQQRFFLLVSSIANILALALFATLSMLNYGILTSLICYALFMGGYCLMYIILVYRKAE